MNPPRQLAKPVLYLLLLGSGFAGLGYQMVWVQMLSMALGHEVVAVLAVLAAFFVGLGLGAWSLSDRLRSSNHPARWYVALELLIAFWALMLVILVPQFTDAVPKWIGATPSPWWHWTIAFGATLLLLLPATAAMGATLPAVDRLVERYHRERDQISGLYAANTLGAVSGTLATAFVLAPALGFTWTLMLCALVNIACACTVAIRYGMDFSPKSDPTAHAPANQEPENSSAELTHEISPRRLFCTLAATGFLGLAYEVIIVRVLSQVLEDTVYTFAWLLAIYLLGTAIGAATYQRLHPNPAYFTRHLRWLLMGLSLTLVLSSASLWVAWDGYELIVQTFGYSTSSAWLGDVLVALAAFLAPTLVMGALFGHMAAYAARRGQLGRAIGTNTLAAAIAPLAVGRNCIAHDWFAIHLGCSRARLFDLAAARAREKSVLR